MRIGISSRSVVVNGKSSYILYSRYLNSLKRHEIVMLLPNQSDEVLSMCDAFIITGGDDVNPKLYNEENTSSNGVNDIIDELDYMIIDHAYKNNKKILGICRGIQVINIYFGGTLVQHVDNHMNILHTIYKMMETNIYDIGSFAVVNSFHHQKIGEVGKGLNPTYLSGDDVVEIIEHENRKIIAVQYHPEINFDCNSKKLFDIIFNDFDC